MLFAPFAVALAVTGHATPAAPDAMARLRADVAHVLDPLVTDSSLQRAKVGVHVVRLSDGAELYSHDADTLLVPASNIKLVTTAAALRVLGPDHQFPTEVYGTLKPSGSLEGDLVIKGYGDPYLIPERVWYLASRLSYLGLRTVPGNLVIDDTFFDGPRMAVGWEQDSTPSAYMAPAGALSVGFNAMLVHVLPAQEVGQPARVLLDPMSDYAPIVGKVDTVKSGRSSVSLDIAQDANHDVIKVSGKINMADTGRAYWRRINDPPMFAGAVIKSALAQVGVQVLGTVKLGTVPATLPKLLEYHSPRLAELIGPLNKYSNNYMAAQVAYAMGAKRFGAPGDWDKGRHAIEDFLTEDVGLPLGSYVLNNASGLHEVNRFSPRQMARILAYMHRQPQLWPEFVNSLAVAGGSGTLQDRMGQTQAAHLLRAKTGTLSGACALSGYVTSKDGEVLAFSFIVNGYSKLEGVWSAQDRFGAALAGLSLGIKPEILANTTVSAVQSLSEGSRP